MIEIDGLHASARRLRRAALGALAPFAFFAAPQSAAGSTVAADHASPQRAIEIIYEAAGGERNDLSVTLAPNGARVLIADPGVAIDPGAGCRGGQEPGAVVSCALAQWSTDAFFVSFALGDGDDSFDSTTLPRRYQRRDGGRTELLISVDGQQGADVLRTGAGEDAISTGDGVDLASAGAGQDIFYGGRDPDGADLLDGGEGVDLASYRERRGPVSVTLDGLANDGAEAEGDQVVSVRNVFGGEGNDLLVGGPSRNFLFGFGGDDELSGRGGRDTLIGDDDEGGPAGDDVLRGGPASDLLVGYGGEDRLLAGRGADRFDAVSVLALGGRERERDVVACGPGRDRGRAEGIDRLSRCERVRRGAK